jgi:hypothetical protein
MTTPGDRDELEDYLTEAMTDPEFARAYETAAEDDPGRGAGVSAPVPNWCACAPPNGFAAEAWFVRARYERGACPCCGRVYVDQFAVRVAVVPVAEGVVVCAGCAAPGHLRDGQGWAPLLAALAGRWPCPA